MDNKERNQILKKAKQGKASLSNTKVREYNDDKEIVMACISSYSGYEILDASERLQKDREVFMLALKRQPEALSHLPNEVKNDLEANLMAATHPLGGKELLSNEIAKKLKDREYALIAVSVNGKAIQLLDENLKEDPEIALAAVKHDGMAYKYVSQSLKYDPVIINEAIKSDEMAKLSMDQAALDIHNKSMTLEAVVKSVLEARGSSHKSESKTKKPSYELEI